MKYCLYFLSLIFFSCNDQQKTSDEQAAPLMQSTVQKETSKSSTKQDICWTGTLNNKTPVFIHYQVDNAVIVGEIIYLNTKDKQPIKLLGTIEEDKSYRLLEFDKTGNITGIIEGTPTTATFNGSWISPKTQKELALTLLPKDTTLASPDIKADESMVFGDYHYQYGKDGYNGDIEISKVGDDKIAFNILSLTNVERGPNIAEVDKDTIEMKGISFTYKIPGSDSCEFKATFYKDFVFVNYTKGYCVSQFGLNATIEGIYLKTKAVKLNTGMINGWTFLLQCLSRGRI